MNKPLNVDNGIKTFLPFLRPYRRHMVFALIALVVTAGTMLSLGKGVQLLIDQGLASGSEAALEAFVDFIWSHGLESESSQIFAKLSLRIC